MHIYIEGAVNNLGNIDFSNNRFIDSCTQLFYKKTFKNATFVPISIVYDKVLDFFSN